MVDKNDYGNFETAWCPGCGNFGILSALKSALASCDLAPENVLLVSGIGQAAKTPHYLKTNVFNGLHGRSLPVALGAKLANPSLTVIAESGDGCMYGEGGNHFLAAVRRNADITIIVHNNRVYGLTKGQASPTSDTGFVTKAQPHGALSRPFNPLSVAIAMGCGFVARGYSVEQDHLKDIICRAICHRGTSLVDIFQPCVSFNHVNTYDWYKEHCYKLSKEYDASDFNLAMEKALDRDYKLAIGVIFEKEETVFEENYSALKEKTTLFNQPRSDKALSEIIKGFQI